MIVECLPYGHHEAPWMNGQRGSGSHVQHFGSTGRCGEKISVLHKDQAENFGVTSWMMGSMEKPCISHLNCSGESCRSSVEFLGQEKWPHSTRL